MVLALWAFCISSVRAQWYDGQQQIIPKLDLRQNIQNHNNKIFLNRNLGRAEPDAYDKYIEDILKQRNSATSQAPLLLENSDKSNTIDRRQPDYGSNESSNPVRFIGVPKTDVEQLNNITYAITTFGINLMKVSCFFFIN